MFEFLNKLIHETTSNYYMEFLFLFFERIIWKMLKIAY